MRSGVRGMGRHGQAWAPPSSRPKLQEASDSCILRHQAVAAEGGDARRAAEVAPECVSIVKNLDATAARLEREANEGVISSVVSFINETSGAPAGSGEGEGSSQSVGCALAPARGGEARRASFFGSGEGEGSSQSVGAVYSGIPTCLLLAGVNLQDHQLTFVHIAEALPRRTPCHVAVLTPTECTSLSACLQSLFTQFAAPATRPKSSSFLAMLRSWHAAKGQPAPPAPESTESPEKKKPRRPAKANKVPQRKVPASVRDAQKDAPLVVLIRDVENFDAAILQDLVALCHQERTAPPGSESSALPFVFILSVSTTRHALHSLLPHSTASKLQIQHRFTLPPAKALLSGLLKEFVLESQHSFCLGEKPLSFLLNRFFTDSCTLKSFTQSLQFAVLTHFEENPLAPLSSDLPAAQMFSLISTKDMLDYIKELPSVSGVSSSKITAKDVCMWLLDISSIRMRLKCAHEVIAAAFIAQGQVFSASTRQKRPPTLHDVLLDALAGWKVREEGGSREGVGLQEGEATSLDNACAAIRFSKPQDLSDALIEIANSLRKLHFAFAALEASFFQEGGLGKAAGIQKGAGTPLKDARDEARRMADLAEEYARAAEEEIDRAPACAPADRGASVLAIQRAGKLRKAPHAEASRSWLEDPESRKLRTDAVNLLKDVLELFPSPSSFPMSEAVCLTRAAQLSRSLDACPRNAVHDALKRPTDYLTPLADGKGDAEGPSSSSAALQGLQGKKDGEMPAHLMPDACILYKLSLEEGRVINIPEWLRSFRSVCRRDKGKIAKGGDAMVQARFMSALSQLQIVGYFKRSKGSSDVAERIVFPPPPPPGKMGDRHAGEQRGLPPAAKKRKEEAEREHQSADGGFGRPRKRQSVK